MTDGQQNQAQNQPAPQETRRRPVRFMGSFSHSLDNKGRLVIPQNFREKLGETFCLAPSYDFKSIAVYPPDQWDRQVESFEKLGHHDPQLNRYLEQFYALSYDEQSCDAQGRVLLPVNIRQKILGEERDVEITGANDHIRVAASVSSGDSWSAFREELPSVLEKIAALERGE